MTKEMSYGNHAHKKPLRYRECGLDDVYLVSGYEWVDAGDGTEDLVVQDIDGLHRAIAECLVTERKMLSGKEFAFLRRYLQMTQPELALELGATVQSLYRWESGQSRVPGTADTALRFIYLARTRPAMVADAAREIVKHLREMERPRGGRMLFRDTKSGWVPLAA